MCADCVMRPLGRGDACVAAMTDWLLRSCCFQTLLPSEAHRKEKLKRAVDWIGRYEKTIAPIVGQPCHALLH